jgi:hypothetical protein
MQKVPGLKEHCERCLRTERWNGNVVLMIVDAAFTSIGLNYFTAVIPKVEEFNRKFIGKWKNKKFERSWIIAKEIALTCRYRPIELCWMTWLIQIEGNIMRIEKYSKILPKFELNNFICFIFSNLLLENFKEINYHLI